MSVEQSEEINRLLDEILTADPFRSETLSKQVLALVEQAEADEQSEDSEAGEGERNERAELVS